MTFVLVLLGLMVLVGAVAGRRAGTGRPRGLATGMELVRGLSKAAVRRRGHQTRPSLAVGRRTPVRQVGIELARVAWRRLYAAMEDVVLIFAPPRSWKTGLLACHIVDAPGGGMCTSTRADLYRLTVAQRQLQGPVRVFNPENVGANGDDPVPNDVRWNLVRGCDEPEEATLRSGYLLSGSTSGDKVSDRGYWESNAARALRCLLHAAALSGGTAVQVYDWAQKLDARAPVTILRTNPGAAPGWAEELQAIQDQDAKPRGSIASTLVLALQFMSIPSLAFAATPGPDEELDIAEFIAAGGWLYVIGTRRDYAPLTPLFSAFAGHIFETCKAIAQDKGGRLDPPFPMVLDEAAQTCRVPLPRWSSEAGGIGVPIVVSVQGLDQLAEMWGESGADTIWTNAAVRMGVAGSVKHLERLSTLCGYRKQRNRRGDLERVPVLTPDEIAALDPREAVVFARGRPTIGTVRPIWERRQPRRRRGASTHPPTGPLAPVLPIDRRRRSRG